MDRSSDTACLLHVYEANIYLSIYPWIDRSIHVDWGAPRHPEASGDTPKTRAVCHFLLKTQCFTSALDDVLGGSSGGGKGVGKPPPVAQGLNTSDKVGGSTLLQKPPESPQVAPGTKTAQEMLQMATFEPVFFRRSTSRFSGPVQSSIPGIYPRTKRG